MLKLKLIIALLLPAALANAQNPVKFGIVSEADFETHYPVDTGPGAVVIADIGNASIIGNTKGWFSILFRHFKRVHVLDKNGFDLANVSIRLYREGENETKLDRLKATTYNIENGKLVQTRLEGKSVFSEKINKNITLKKFSFPAVKEGSIIEFEYTTISDFVNLPDAWEFQGAYPRLWSEYTLETPSFFTYVFLRQGYLKYDITDRKDGVKSYNVRITTNLNQMQNVSVTAGVSEFKWVVRNVPPLREENFTTSINNHLQKIQFELSEQSDPLEAHHYIESWEQVTEWLLGHSDFGKPLTENSDWFSGETGPVIKGVTDNLQKAKRIFEYVRDNYTCTDNSALFIEKTMRDVIRNKNGNVAELNLLLVGLMRQAGIDADPVILSTRDHGVVYEAFPIITQFNYVISRIKVNGKDYFLDASGKEHGFGFLPLRCYNESARVVNAAAEQVKLSADQLSEKKSTTIFIINEKGNWTGTVQQTPGYYESTGLRQSIKEKGNNYYDGELKKAYGSEFSVKNIVIDSLENKESRLGIKYEIIEQGDKEEIIYFNPMLAEGYRENPFKSSSRQYPVEMPYSIDEIYTLLVEIPDGYEVDEMPAEAIVKFNRNDEGLFEYRLSRSGNSLSLRSRLLLKKANYLPEEYNTLREFFDLVVKKHAESIVFKKKK
jgi:hypothetical protein